MNTIVLPTAIDEGIYPTGWPLAKASYDAVNSAYGMAIAANDKWAQIQLFG
jgi:hypothetical protein